MRLSRMRSSDGNRRLDVGQEWKDPKRLRPFSEQVLRRTTKSSLMSVRCYLTNRFRKVVSRKSFCRNHQIHRAHSAHNKLSASHPFHRAQ
mmetsp:Transcript_1833/g.3280  ORF Transcript_1833/g.3280 Transcript_1833/m.3280 type:complete len:90 (+) Transcript_1833:1214-1483(+)